jgi:hypothetical protein
MRKQIQFGIDDAMKALDTTKRFFINQGFKLTTQTDSSVSFTKGSKLQNVSSINPLNWKSTIDIMIVNNIMLADFNIDTTGQIVTPEEEALWNSFLEKYKVSVIDNMDVTNDIKAELKRTQQNTWKYVGWAFVGGVVGIIPCALLARLTGFDFIAPIGAAGGAILFMMNRINKDRQRE